MEHSHLHSTNARHTSKIIIATHPMEAIVLDIFHWNKDSWLIIVDVFSRWCKTYHMTEKLPNIMMVDAGPNFISAEIKEFCENKKIEHYSVSPNNHKGNGICERTIQTIKNKMNKISDQHGWNTKKIANKATKSYNSSYHKTIGCTPNLRWYGREITTKRNLKRTAFSDPRWNGPAKIIELGRFDSYWIEQDGKTFRRNIQDIRPWTVKITTKVYREAQPKAQTLPTSIETPITRTEILKTNTKTQENDDVPDPEK
eukprot:TRINITY_DN1898_c0_g1_i2.p1 TRINITY_DN1898_c0_g1~~TRINITY_DN1898_c0_g1_i2.p1  ORF type:complete len:256 (-),score=21.23 TRINITY_DN1898_c0_g1_i2:156-923(-)